MPAFFSISARGVTPAKVRVKVTLIGMLVVTLSFAPWAPIAPGQWSLAEAVLMQTVFLMAGAFVLWCVWPRLRLGIAPELLAEDELIACQQQEGALRLTFDDGPTAGLTDSILDLLKSNNVKASFFVLLPKARQCPQLIRRIIREGHQLGLHGKDHRGPFMRSSGQIARDLTEAKNELERIAQTSVRLYRPSHGWKTPGLLRAVRRAQLLLCFWDVGVWDTDAPESTVLLRRLQRAGAAAKHGKSPTVLLHDGRDDALQYPAHGQSLLTALKDWLPQLRTLSSNESQS